MTTRTSKATNVEVFLATADNAGRFDASVVDSSIVTIRDDADAPAQVVYDLSVDPQSFSEADRTITFTITRSDYSEDASVWFSTVQDTGFDNISDYVGIEEREVFFAAGDSVETVTLRINDDSDPEADETFGAIVQLSRFDSFTKYEDRVTFTILNDDGAVPTPSVNNVSSPSYAADTELTLLELFQSADLDVDTSQLTILDQKTTGGAEWIYNGEVLDLNQFGYFSPTFYLDDDITYRVGNSANDFNFQISDQENRIIQENFIVGGNVDLTEESPEVRAAIDVLFDSSSTALETAVALAQAKLFVLEEIDDFEADYVAKRKASEYTASFLDRDSGKLYNVEFVDTAIQNQALKTYIAQLAESKFLGFLKTYGGLGADLSEFAYLSTDGISQDDVAELLESLALGFFVEGPAVTIGVIIATGGAAALPFNPAVGAAMIIAGGSVAVGGITLANSLDEEDVFKPIINDTLDYFQSDQSSSGEGPLYWSDSLYDPYRTQTSTEPVSVVNRISLDDDEFIQARDEAEVGSLATGANFYAGSPDQLSGDDISEFDEDDTIVLWGVDVSRENIPIGESSAIISLRDSGTLLDTVPLRLAGDFSGGDFMAVSNGADTFISFHKYLPVLQDGFAVAPENINGVTNPAFLSGMATSAFQVEISGQADMNNATGVYEVDQNGIIRDVRLISKDTQADLGKTLIVEGVEQEHSLGFFLVQNGAAWASELASDDVLTFAVSDVSGAPRLELHVNGALANQTVHHSIDPSLNADGLEHVLSGVAGGGTSMFVAFEESSSEGDRDFNDVILKVSTPERGPNVVSGTLAELDSSGPIQIRAGDRIVVNDTEFSQANTYLDLRDEEITIDRFGGAGSGPENTMSVDVEDGAVLRAIVERGDGHTVVRFAEPAEFQTRIGPQFSSAPIDGSVISFLAQISDPDENFNYPSVVEITEFPAFGSAYYWQENLYYVGPDALPLVSEPIVDEVSYVARNRDGSEYEGEFLITLSDQTSNEAYPDGHGIWSVRASLEKHDAYRTLIKTNYDFSFPVEFAESEGVRLQFVASEDPYFDAEDTIISETEISSEWTSGSSGRSTYYGGVRDEPFFLMLRQFNMDTEYVSLPVLIDPKRASLNAEVAETGILTLTHNAQTVTLQRSYENPVVIAFVATENGSQPVNVRISEVDGNDLTLQLQEPNYLDGSHINETVNYLVIEAGTWVLPGGTVLEAGTLDSNQLSSQGFETVTFGAEFDSAPVVLSQVQTFNGSDFVTTRQHDANADSFQLTMQEEEALNDGGHTTETIGWIAIEAGGGTAGDVTWLAGSTSGVTDANASVALGTNIAGGVNVIAALSSFAGSDPAWARGNGSTSTTFDLSIEEEASSDGEIVHIPETVDYFAFNQAGFIGAYEYDFLV